MARLIDADDLIDAIKDRIDEEKEMYPDDKVSIIFRAGMKTVIGIIKNQDTVDTVKHGRWIICREFDHKLKCSQCGCHTVWMDEVVPNYCPYCGARMIELKK